MSNTTTSMTESSTSKKGLKPNAIMLYLSISIFGLLVNAIELHISIGMDDATYGIIPTVFGTIIYGTLLAIFCYLTPYWAMQYIAHLINQSHTEAKKSTN